MPMGRIYKHRGKRTSDFQKLKKEVKQLKKVATPELKFIDSDLDSANVSTTLLKIPINLSAEGDSVTTRDGNQILVKDVMVRGLLTTATDEAAVPSLTRLMVVMDYEQDSTSLFSTTDLLQSDDIDSFKKMDQNQRRFSILYDKVHYCGSQNSTTGVTTDPAKKWIEIKIRLNRKVYYNGASATEASLGRGKLHFCLISDAANLVDFEGTSRVTFQDS